MPKRQEVSKYKLRRCETPGELADEILSTFPEIEPFCGDLDDDDYIKQLVRKFSDLGRARLDIVSIAFVQYHTKHRITNLDTLGAGPEMAEFFAMAAAITRAADEQSAKDFWRNYRFFSHPDAGRYNVGAPKFLHPYLFIKSDG